jgi:hypothetical protein
MRRATMWSIGIEPSYHLSKDMYSLLSRQILTYVRLSTSGINAGLNLDVRPSKYRLRAVVQEAVDGKIADSILNIEVK